MSQQTPCNSQILPSKARGEGSIPRSPGLTMHAETWVRSQQTGSQEFTGEAFTCPQEPKGKGINLTQLKNLDFASTCTVSKQYSMSESELSTFLLQANVRKSTYSYSKST